MSIAKLFNATKQKSSPLILSASIAALVMSAAPAANAVSFDQQINQLKQNNSQTAQKQQQLSHEAKTLSDKIADLQDEITALDSQISQTTSKIDALNQDISKAEVELARQRGLLGINVRAMYTEQDTDTLVMLASSNNLSHYLDRQKYRESLQEKIDAATNRVKKLMSQLDHEKKMVEKLLIDQQSMQSNLAAQRAESNRLLGLNEAQRQAYQNELNANNAKVAELQRQQAAENGKGVVSKPAPVEAKPAPAPAPQPGIKKVDGRNYPWANVPFPNSMPDPWGMYKRQCVSYTAWMVAESGRHMPYWGGRGNAKLWDDNARRAGIPVDQNPRVGDVAISNGGTYGHSMYVEAVHGDGTITVSQYNAGWSGSYSEVRRSAAGLWFIHF